MTTYDWLMMTGVIFVTVGAVAAVAVVVERGRRKEEDCPPCPPCQRCVELEAELMAALQAPPPKKNTRTMWGD